MGCIESKKVNLVLTQDDLNFLIARTRFDEDTIKEWFKGSIELNPNHFHENFRGIDFTEKFNPTLPRLYSRL